MTEGGTALGEAWLQRPIDLHPTAGILKIFKNLSLTAATHDQK